MLYNGPLLCGFNVPIKGLHLAYSVYPCDMVTPFAVDDFIAVHEYNTSMFMFSI